MQLYQKFVAGIVVGVVALVTTNQIVEAREQMNGSEIRQTVTDKRIYLKIPLGGEFPLRYRGNGLVDGDGTAVGLGRHFAPKETGKWWIDGDRLCQQWKTWYKGQVACFELFRVSDTRLYWKRNDGRSGRARIGR